MTNAVQASGFMCDSMGGHEELRAPFTLLQSLKQVSCRADQPTVWRFPKPSAAMLTSRLLVGCSAVSSAERS